MGLGLLPGHIALRERVRAISAPIAERAAALDAAASYPYENFEDLRRSGLLSLLIPTQHGGQGADYLSFAIVVEEIARACASTAICYTMHTATYDAMTDGTPEQQSRFFTDIVQSGSLWCRALSEPGSGSHFLLPQAVARRTEGGFRLTGAKFFTSGASGASFALANAVLESAPGDGVCLFAVPVKGNPDVVIEGEWDAHGLRASDSRTIRFNDCFVPENSLIGPEGAGSRLLAGRPSLGALGIAATGVGIAQAAYDAAEQHARTRRIAPDPHPISHYQAIRFLVAEMKVSIDAQRLVTHQGAWYADHRPAEARIPLAEAKYITNVQSIEVTQKAMQVVGGRGFVRGHPVERYVRDARAGALMALSVEQSLDLIGKLALGVESVPNTT